MVRDRMVMTLDSALDAGLGDARRHARLDASCATSCPPHAEPRLQRSALASSFVAALELARLGKAELAQEDVFGPLHLRRVRGVSEPPDDLVRAVEAALFAAEEPLTAEALSAHLARRRRAARRWPSSRRITRERGVRLVERGGRWQFQTAPDLAHLLRREREQVRKLSRAATEVLAIVAYHEPVSRAEIEAIRGVQTSPGTLDVLMEAGWVRVAGRREVPGRPVIYATTPEFLSHFGLASRSDLPGIDELKAAGLLDPVDDAYDELAGRDDDRTDADEARTSPTRWKTPRKAPRVARQGLRRVA